MVSVFLVIFWPSTSVVTWYVGHLGSAEQCHHLSACSGSPVSSRSQAITLTQKLRIFLILLVKCVCVCVCYLFSRVWLFATLWTRAHQAPLSMGFPRQEYWSGLLFPSSRDLRDPGPSISFIGRWILSHQGSPHYAVLVFYSIVFEHKLY